MNEKRDPAATHATHARSWGATLRRGARTGSGDPEEPTGSAGVPGSVLLFLLALACGPPPAPPRLPPLPPAPAPPAWPAAGALSPADLGTPLGHVPPVVVIDAGHGAPGNPGNTSIHCEEEQDEMRRIQDDLVSRLGGMDLARVRTGRPAGTMPRYATRVRRAEAEDALFLQLHSDTRGSGTVVDTRPPDVCVSNPDEPGFAILWSDEGAPELVEQRLRLARALARHMAAAGFLPYDGSNYAGIYGGDAVPGVFVDRHTPRQRIYVLRRPRVPSVIIETHHAWDEQEVARWQEEETLEAFAVAVGAAVVEVSTAP